MTSGIKIRILKTNQKLLTGKQLDYESLLGDIRQDIIC